MVEDHPDLGEKAISKVVEIGISSQLDAAEQLNVDIRTDLGKLIQGELDSVEVVGKGLVLKPDLRLEILEISTDEVAIAPLSVLFGQIELLHSTDVEARVVLTEVDINRALSSEAIQSQLQGLSIQLREQPVTIDVRKTEITLPGDNQFVIATDFLIKETGEVKKLSATAIPQLKENGQRLTFELLSAEGQGLTPELGAAILEQLIALLDLRNLNISGVTLQLRQVEIHSGRLVVHIKTQVEQIPS